MKTDGYHLSTGQRTEVPYRCRSADACIVVESVNAGAVASSLAPDGLLAVRLADGSGVGALWIMRYEHSTVGAYPEVVFTFAAAPTPITLARSGPFAAVAALAEPQVRLFISRLLLRAQDTLSIAYGREILHLDKLPVDKLEVRREQVGGATRKLVTANSADRPLMECDITEDNSIVTWLGTPVGLAAAALPSVVRRAHRGLELTGQAPRRLGGGTIISVLSPALPRVQLFKPCDRLCVHPGHPFTDDVISSGFVPRLVVRTRSFGMVMNPAR